LYYILYFSSKKRNRQEIADSLINEVSVVAPSRLLNMLGQALKFQQVQGSLPITNNYDLFQGGVVTVNKDIDEKYPKKTSGNIRFSKGNNL
jgi:WD40 repeat-containing protein SMU1